MNLLTLYSESNKLSDKFSAEYGCEYVIEEDQCDLLICWNVITIES